jgi:hypothetical protein
MKILNNTENDILIQAKRMGYLIQESISVGECYFIIDMNTNLVIAGAQDFLAWDEVVMWVVEAGSSPTLN